MKNKKVTIITGDRHSGKTTRLLNHIETLKDSGVTVAGIVSIGTIKNNVRDSFSLKDISTNTEKAFMSRNKYDNCEKIGRFYINNETYQWGLTVLEKAIISDVSTIVIDEIGMLELNEKGWYSVLIMALKSNKNIVITVRDKFIDEVVLKFGINLTQVINI